MDANVPPAAPGTLGAPGGDEDVQAAPHPWWASVRRRRTSSVVLALAVGFALLARTLLAEPETDGEVTAGRFDRAFVTLDGGAQWSGEGLIQSLWIAGPRAPPVDLRLPFPPSQCRRIAQALTAVCEGGTIRADTPLRLTWGIPQLVTIDVPASRRVVLSPLPDNRPRLLVGNSSGPAPAVCFVPPARGVLTLAVGLGGTTWRAQPGSFSLACEETLLLRIAGSRPHHPTSGLALHGIESFEVEATSSTASLTGTDGQLELGGAAETVGVGDRVDLRAADRLRTTLLVRGSTATLEVGSAKLSSAQVDGNERVESRVLENAVFWMGVVATVSGLVATGIGVFRWASKGAKS